MHEVLGQETVYLVKSPTGRNGNKIHLREDCPRIKRDDVSVVSKPASVYPEGFHDVCGVCGDGDE